MAADAQRELPYRSFLSSLLAHTHRLCGFDPGSVDETPVTLNEYIISASTHGLDTIE
jgi:hypothetical protein